MLTKFELDEDGKSVWINTSQVQAVLSSKISKENKECTMIVLMNELAYYVKGTVDEVVAKLNEF